MRIALGVEYDGSAFAGWQWQRGRRTVQAVLEEAVGRVAAAPVRVHAAGRTDAGVHALEQVVHFESLAPRPMRSWLLGVNSALPEDIRVLWARQVPDDFHARYSAIARCYRYVILNRPMKSALHRAQVTWCFRPLDEGRMREAAGCLVGEHDFSSFRAQHCQSKSPIRRMYFIDVRRETERVVIEMAANAFVHHMVRNIAGMLIAIGTGQAEPLLLRQVLEARRRAAAGVTAPPDGLYLSAIFYPARFQLPSDPVFSRLPPDAARFQPAVTDDDVSLAANSR
jgi:tRNA pseudouridine38-40 synthase